MKLINVVFEDDLDDVDIIEVPDFIANDLNKYADGFIKWLCCTQDTRFIKKNKNGNTYYVCETDGFLYWLNNFVINAEERAVLVLEHVMFDNRYNRIDF